MPTYEYVCTKCGDQFEVVQSFSDDALTTCAKCKGPLRKVFGSVGIVFKGSGFYKTDSRGGSSASTPPASAATTGESTATETPSKSDPAPATTPAPAKEKKASKASD